MASCTQMSQHTLHNEQFGKNLKYRGEGTDTGLEVTEVASVQTTKTQETGLRFTLEKVFKSSTGDGRLVGKELFKSEVNTIVYIHIDMKIF